MCSEHHTAKCNHALPTGGGVVLVGRSDVRGRTGIVCKSHQARRCEPIEVTQLIDERRAAEAIHRRLRGDNELWILLLGMIIVGCTMVLGFMIGASA